MDLIPAVDLLDGVAVRLLQGDYDRRVAQLRDPDGAIRGWMADGVRWLHLVDLEGARSRRPVHLNLASRLATTAHDANPEARVELGGGLRTPGDIEAVLASAVDVAVLGTAAVEDPSLVAECAGRWPGRVAVSIDVRDDRPALDGWLRQGRGDVVELARRVAAAGAAHVVVTDVTRDGTKLGPNLDLLQRARAALPDTRLVAAGGIGTAHDIRRLAVSGIDGAIVGLALVDGSLRVADALVAAGAA